MCTVHVHVRVRVHVQYVYSISVYEGTKVPSKVLSYFRTFEGI